jgi:hypothetical protein
VTKKYIIKKTIAKLIKASWMRKLATHNANKVVTFWAFSSNET